MDRSFIVLAMGGLLNVTVLLSSLMGLSMDAFNICYICGYGAGESGNAGKR